MTTADTITNADDALSTSQRMHALCDMESEGSRSPQVAPVTYTRENLLDICETHAHPAIRRIAADMLYSMGQRDYCASQVSK